MRFSSYGGIRVVFQLLCFQHGVPYKIQENSRLLTEVIFQNHFSREVQYSVDVCNPAGEFVINLILTIFIF